MQFITDTGIVVPAITTEQMIEDEVLKSAYAQVLIFAQHHTKGSQL